MSLSGLVVLALLSATPAELRWGADAEGGAPFLFEQPPGRFQGFELELVEALAARLGRTPRHVQGPFAQLLPLLERGDVDVVINGIEITPDRERAYGLTRPYWAGPERLTVRGADAHAPSTLADLRGRPAGTLSGTLAERMLRAAGADIRTYDGGQEDPYKDLLLGRIDAVLLEAPVSLYYGELPGLTTLPASMGETRYAVVTRKGDVALQHPSEENRQRHRGQRDGKGDQRPSAPAWWRGGAGAVLGALGRGALITLAISLASMALAILLGGMLALARVYGPRPLRLLALGYVELFRGTPLLLQLIVVYYGLPEIGLRLSPWVAGWLALGLNYAAAEAENDRAGLLSVPGAQMDAARVLGMSRWQGLRHVVAPQAIRVALPPVTNDFIALLKDSSLVSIVTVTELTKTYGTLAAATRDHLGLGLVVAALYLALGLPFARLSRWLEGRLTAHLEVRE